MKNKKIWLFAILGFVLFAALAGWAISIVAPAISLIPTAAQDPTALAFDPIATPRMAATEEENLDLGATPPYATESCNPDQFGNCREEEPQCEMDPFGNCIPENPACKIDPFGNFVNPEDCD